MYNWMQWQKSLFTLIEKCAHKNNKPNEMNTCIDFPPYKMLFLIIRWCFIQNKHYPDLLHVCTCFVSTKHRCDWHAMWYGILNSQQKQYESTKSDRQYRLGGPWFRCRRVGQRCQAKSLSVQLHRLLSGHRHLCRTRRTLPIILHMYQCDTQGAFKTWKWRQ